MKSGIRFSLWPTFAVLVCLSLSACASGPKSPKPLSKQDQIKGLLSVAGANVSDNDPIGAIESLNKVRDLDDSIPECYYLYSLAYMAKKETRLSIEAARYAIKLDPKYSAAKNTLGKLLLDQGKLDEAQKYLLESANDLLFRWSYMPKINLGILFYKKMDLKNSELWLSRAIEDKNSNLNCMAYYYRGKIKMDQGEFKQAERDLILGTKDSCAGISDAHLAFGQALIREKKYDEARAKFVEIQRLFPSSDTSDRATEYLREIP